MIFQKTQRAGFQRLIVLFGSLCLAGCQQYVSQPLTAQSVECALQPPTKQALQSQAKSLNNPRLTSVLIDPADGLSPDEAAVIAVLVNPTLRSVRDQRLLADAQVIQAGILPNPTLNYNLDVPIGANSGDNVNGYGLGIDWDVTALIARNAKVAAAKRAGQRVALDVAWQEWQVAQAARQACYDVASLRRQLADAEGLASEIGIVADRFQAALARHDVTAADASTAGVAAHEARLTVATTTRDLRDARLALNAALGLPPEYDVHVSDDVAAPDRFVVPDVDDLIDNVANRRLDLIALRRGYAAQEATVRAAVLSQFPKITLGIANTRDFGDFLTLGPTATADLPFFDRNQGAIAAERATRQRLFDEYVARLFEARSDIARSAALVDSLNAVIKVQAEQVATLHRALDLNRRALLEGGVPLGTFYVAAIELTNKQADLNRYRQDLLHALIAIELASGVYMPATRETNRPATRSTTEASP